MMRHIKYIIVILLLLVCTGCVKLEEDMEIKSNKSMTYTINLSSYDKDVVDKYFNKDDINNLKRYYSIKEYKKDNYKGIKLVWKVKNIDDVSSTSDVVFSLNSIKDSIPTNVFKVSKGWFHNDYSANFIFNVEDIIDEDISIDESNNNLIFKVMLDKSVKSNNADKVKGNTLIWNLDSSNTNEINFSFSMFNYSHIIITIIFALFFLLVTILSFKKILEKRV